MNVIGIGADEQHYIFQLLAAILWTGNISFQDTSGGGSKIRDENGAKKNKISNLLCA